LQTVTHSLYNLATYPEYVQPLREEIEAVIQEQGWSKASITKMTKLDSFVKETMRLSPISACTYLICHHYICSKNNSAASMRRKVLKDFTFSDGTTIPAGNILSVAASCIHTDPVKILHRYPRLGSRTCTSTGQLRRRWNLRWLPL
jgi:cytochrome P450